MVADIPGLLDMVELPEGTFWMGLAEDDAQAYDTVSGFAIGRVVVTCQIESTQVRWEQYAHGYRPATEVEWE